MKVRINNQIRADELRLLDAEGGNLGVMSFVEAMKEAERRGVDLIEVNPNSKPPLAKLMDYGKFQYEQSKKESKARAGAKSTETKSVQIKIGTGQADLELKARTASKWLKEGHRIKVELYLSGRAKYLDQNFLKERLDRVLHLITENYKIADPLRKGPKGYMIMIERDTKKQV